jgi:hypothetical protein
VRDKARKNCYLAPWPGSACLFLCYPRGACQGQLQQPMPAKACNGALSALGPATCGRRAWIELAAGAAPPHAAAAHAPWRPAAVGPCLQTSCRV